jgi:hypothetical protein
MTTQLISNELYVSSDYLNKGILPKAAVPKAPNNTTQNFVWEIASTTNNAGVNMQTASWVEVQDAPPQQNAIINSEPSITSTQGSFLVSDGTNPFNAHFTDLLKANDVDNVINTYGDIRLHNTTSNPNYSSIGMNEDDGMDIVNFNGEITFATQQYTRTFNQMASDIDKLKEIITNLTTITFT